MNQKQQELLKRIQAFGYKKDAREVFKEAIEYEALRLALLTEPSNYKIRIQKQKDILKRYSSNDLHKFKEIGASLHSLLKDMLNCYEDLLGEIFMELGCANRHNQQYFTPKHVASLMAKINLSNIDLSKPVITINDPACGSGILLIAMLEELNAQKINYTNQVLIVASDIDKTCTALTYLQLAYCGAAAVIKHQNSLTQQVIGETYITPAFALQYNKFKKTYDALTS